MKKILLPTDFSENSASAIAYGLDFYKGQKIAYYILHVIDPSQLSPHSPNAALEVLSQQKKLARKHLEHIKKDTIDLLKKTKQNETEITLLLEVGHISQVIYKKAKELDVHLIIMGTHGANHNKLEKIFGSVSTAVLDTPFCPIIFIPMDYKFKSINTILFGTNLDDSDPFILAKAMKHLEPYTAIIHCLYVNPTKSTEELNPRIEKISDYLINHPESLNTKFHVAYDESVDSAILEYANLYDADLIIMHKSNKSFWDRLFHRNHCREMIFKIALPLMIIQ